MCHILGEETPKDLREKGKIKKIIIFCNVNKKYLPKRKSL